MFSQPGIQASNIRPRNGNMLGTPSLVVQDGEALAVFWPPAAAPSKP
jgi:hypothetical protein